jgi:hypothetical protein
MVNTPGAVWRSPLQQKQSTRPGARHVSDPRSKDDAAHCPWRAHVSTSCTAGCSFHSAHVKIERRRPDVRLVRSGGLVFAAAARLRKCP